MNRQPPKTPKSSMSGMAFILRPGRPNVRAEFRTGNAKQLLIAKRGHDPDLSVPVAMLNDSRQGNAFPAGLAHRYAALFKRILECVHGVYST